MQGSDMRSNKAVFTYRNGLEAHCQQTPTGLEIFIPKISEQPVAYIALWYAANPTELTKYSQSSCICAGSYPDATIMLQDPRSEDPLAVVSFYPDQTLVEFDIEAVRLVDGYPFGVIGLSRSDDKECT